ncbi:MAG: DNA internalization-related competence protein ComEC/Rec2 [Calditrichaeota bacterium]|nr:MAG: DNA internalization-related competence protein ComEC/Rec2 [Calditrichota bacterium]
MNRYPVMFLLVFFTIGIISASNFREWLTISELISGISICLLATVLFLRYQRISALFLGSAILLAGCASYQFAEKETKFTHLADIETFARVRVTGKIASDITFKNNQFRFDLAIESIELAGSWESEKGCVRVTAKSIPEALKYGSRLLLQGNWLRPKPPRYPGGFDYRRYLLAQDIGGLIKVRKDGAIVPLEPAQNYTTTLPVLMAMARENVWSIIQIIADSEAAPILKGLLVGDRDLIDPEIIATFSKIGIIHVLAISGLHVGFILLMAYGLGNLLHFPRVPLNIFVLLIIWSFALFTGLKTPVFRAVIMFTVFTVARLRDRSTNGFSLLALSGLIILLINPAEIFMVGFQLSFSAVAGILYFYPKLERFLNKFKFWAFIWNFEFVGALVKLVNENSKMGQFLKKSSIEIRPLKFFPALFLVTLAAQLGTAPFMFLHFGTFSFVSFIANLLVIPAIFVTVFISVPTLCIYFLLPLLSALSGNVIDLIVHIILDVSEYFSEFSWANIVNYYPDPLHVTVVFLIFIYLVEWQKKYVRYFLILTLLSVLNWDIWAEIYFRDYRNMKITMLDVGQGDATVIEIPGNKVILIDAGPVFPGYNSAQEVILPYLMQAGVNCLDKVIITHPHLDHYGGLAFLAENISMGQVIFADTSYADKTFQKLVRSLRSKGVVINIIKRGDVVTDFDPVLFYILGPTLEQAKIKRNWNHASLVLKLRYGNSTALFTGDTELQGEFELQKFDNFLVSNLLKAGHHGSKTSSGINFLQKVNPDWVTISAGAFNKFDHPAGEVIDRYREKNIKIARTDCDGALQFATDGYRLWRIVN